MPRKEILMFIDSNYAVSQVLKTNLPMRDFNENHFNVLVTF